MMDFRGFLRNRQFQAFCGAFVLHALVFSALFSWRPTGYIPEFETLPIVFVEAPDEPEPVFVPEIEVIPEPEPPEPELAPPETTPDFVPPPEPSPAPVEAAPVQAVRAPEQTPPQQERAPLVFAEPAPPPSNALSTPLAGLEEEEETDEEGAATQIPPQYRYQFETFSETAPGALARVSKAVNCARANRDTRPFFCPDYDEDDLFLASLTQNRPASDYDPVFDAAIARSALGRFDQPSFSDRQLKSQFTGVSESFVRRHAHDPILPDRDCRRISFGFTDPFQLDKNAAVPDNTAVYCEQSLAE